MHWIMTFQKLALSLTLTCLVLPIIFSCTGSTTSATSTPPSPDEVAIFPSPTATLTPDPAINGGGVLTSAQKRRLSSAAIAYIADTESEAVKIADSLHYLDTAAHPASICGPLAIAILQDAGLLDPAIDRHDFWQLNPRPDYGLPTLERTFPRDRYEWISVNTPLDEVDFEEFPLYPGDFLYTYAGPNGSFEHMLVVSRVDAQGRAFSVTNLNTPQGYIIQEVLLYDPAQPGVGMFYDWTDLANNPIGNTGFGGFEIWRLSAAIQDPDPSVAELRSAVQDQVTSVGGHWNIYFSQIGGEVFMERLIDESIHPASTIKVPIAMLFLKTLGEMGVTDLASYLSTHVIEDRPMDQLLRFMLVFSEEEAANIVVNWITQNGNYIDQLAAGGAPHTTLIPRSTTLRDLSNLYQTLYTGIGMSVEAQQIILDLLLEYTPNDDIRLGRLRTLLGENTTVYNKRGTITAERLIVADAAIVEYGSDVYFVLVFAQPEPGLESPAYEQLETAFASITDLLAEFITARSSAQP